MATKKVSKLSKVGAAKKAQAAAEKREKDQELIKTLEKTLKAGTKITIENKAPAKKVIVTKPVALVKKVVAKKVHDDTPPFDLDNDSKDVDSMISAAFEKRGIKAVAKSPEPVQIQTLMDKAAEGENPAIAPLEAKDLAPTAVQGQSFTGMLSDVHRLTKTEQVKAESESDYAAELSERRQAQNTARRSNTVSAADLGLISRVPNGQRQQPPSQARPPRERPQHLTLIGALFQNNGNNKS